jgi:UDP-sugar transporter A1/2/3
MGRLSGEKRDAPLALKLGSCFVMLFFSVAATIFAGASKTSEGVYPYNTFMLPCLVEICKFLASAMFLARLIISGRRPQVTFSSQKMALYSLPALCYFVSNNCMFYIIRDLGSSTFQVMNNLKILSTAVLMRFFLDRKISWLRWKALVILAAGTVITQLKCGEDIQHSSNSSYLIVLLNALASGAGSVLSEKLLKGIGLDTEDSIHWQNMQLYLFGALFGWLSYMHDGKSVGYGNNPLTGFNLAAYATVVSLSIMGLSVSFVLKHIDNIAKCFVTALSMIAVALIETTMNSRAISLHVGVGVCLACLAIEQYHLSPQ